MWSQFAISLYVITGLTVSYYDQKTITQTQLTKTEPWKVYVGFCIVTVVWPAFIAHSIFRLVNQVRNQALFLQKASVEIATIVRNSAEHVFSASQIMQEEGKTDASLTLVQIAATLVECSTKINIQVRKSL